MTSFSLKQITNEFCNNSKICMLIRSCENKGRLSGCLTGWLDSKLSDYGIKQSHFLSINLFNDIQTILKPNNSYITYISDMSRAKHCKDICFNYSNNSVIKDSLLRDIHYGSSEGLFYDGLSDNKKEELSNYNYKFENGESYLDVKFRGLKFISNHYSTLYSNKSIVFSHNIFNKSIILNNNINSNDIILFKLKNDQFSIETKEVIDKYQKNFYKKDITSENNLDNINKIRMEFNKIIKKHIDIIGYYTIEKLEEDKEQLSSDK